VAGRRERGSKSVEVVDEEGRMRLAGRGERLLDAEVQTSLRPP